MSGVEDVVGQMSKRKLRDKYLSNWPVFFNIFWIRLILCFVFPFRFKQFNNKYIRPCLIRDHAGHEPKILETYAKLAMKDAIELVRRKSSTTSPMATDVLPTATMYVFISIMYLIVFKCFSLPVLQLYFKNSDVQQEQAASSPSTNIKDVQLTDDSWRPDKKVITDAKLLSRNLCGIINTKCLPGFASFQLHAPCC